MEWIIEIHEYNSSHKKVTATVVNTKGKKFDFLKPEYVKKIT